ncbi:MAG TPA: LPS assembly lipoprotein LptE [Marinobacter sp.]|nr:LPS assembly lipoprotein LptE [Marinobacter sp.]
MWWPTNMPRRVPLEAVCRQFLAVLLTVMAGGCGFQLRGAPPVSPALQPLAVSCANQVPISLCEAVLDQLTLGGVNLQDERTAKFVLRLSNFEQDRRATAITGQAAAAEYTLRYSVGMELISQDKMPMIASTRLTTSESYRYDEANVLAKQREEDTLRTQLNNRLAQQVIFRLAPLTEARIQAIRDQQSKVQ